MARISPDAPELVDHGIVEVRTSHGARMRLVPGDVLSLARVGPAILLAVGPDDAVVTTVRRTSPTLTSPEGALAMKMPDIGATSDGTASTTTLYRTASFTKTNASARVFPPNFTPKISPNWQSLHRK